MTPKDFLSLIPFVLPASLLLLCPEPARAQTGDEVGMARELGPATWARCAAQLSNPRAKAYELSQIRSNTMPMSPFAGDFRVTYLPTAGLPGSTQVFNMEVLNENANPGQQGTQIDALGHFAYLATPWNGTPPVPVDGARYYGGFTQKDVKPEPGSPLLKLGIEKIAPIVTTAVLLDAKRTVGKGQAMKPGEVVTPQHIQEMLQAQGLQERGILPGDVVYIYTGWSEKYQDPDIDKVYYSMGPGLSYDTAKFLGEKRIVAIGLDTPFIDAVAEGQFAGNAAPPAGTPAGLALAAHHQFLTQAGVHHIENAKLDELARDQVWTPCTMVLPLREKGAAGGAVRPVAIGAPAQ
jgi:kynurenine formamidase